MNLYDLDYAALEAQLAAWDEPPAHARAIWRGLYRRLAADVARIAAEPTLSASLRERLAAEATVIAPALVASQRAPDDGARKDLLRLADGETVEVVLLRYRHRHSACISTQVGCACGCRFCATGQMGFVRDLGAGEIVAQAMHMQRALRAQGAALSNLVLMGMGEPLLNYENTLAALRIVCDPRGLGLVERRVTLSTVGIVPGIERLAQEPLRVSLAVSLHAATDAVRERLLPINRRYPLDALFGALRHYAEVTGGRRVMVEWALVEGVNDGPAQAEALVARLAGLPAHVNLIRLNPTAGYAAQPKALDAADAFVAVLDRAGVPHTVRQRRGAEIAAGCGQLRQRAGQ